MKMGMEMEMEMEMVLMSFYILCHDDSGDSFAILIVGDTDNGTLRYLCIDRAIGWG